MRKRNIQKKFYLNGDEQKILSERARACGITESSYIRALIKGRVPKPKPDEEFYKDMRVLYAVSNNLNQLTVKSHTYDYIDSEELQDILNNLGKFINDIQRKYLVPDEGG